MSVLTTDPVAFNLDAANAELAELSAAERLRWGERHFGPRMALLGSMQKTSCVLTHLLADVNRDREIVFVDTGFHFRETLQLRDRLIRKYKVDVVTLYPEETPEQQETRFGRKLHLFVDGQPECCRLRKEEPFLNYVRESGKKLVVNGVRRSEGGRRKQLKFVMPDPRIDGFVLHPLLDWTDEVLVEFIRANEVPVHPLHERNYPSIGCQCCTTPVAPGEDPRAGRWRHLRTGEDQPAYCGINFTDGGGI
jgi:phosphoadenosine phosphosulfate reductase